MKLSPLLRQLTKLVSNSDTSVQVCFGVIYYDEPATLASGHHMATNAKATIRLKLRSGKQLTTLLDSLNPEAKGTLTRRAQVRLGENGLCLLLTVEAEDEVALRSTLNAYLRWVNSTLNVLETIG